MSHTQPPSSPYTSGPEGPPPGYQGGFPPPAPVEGKKAKPAFWRRGYMIAAYALVAFLVGSSVGSSNSSKSTDAAGTPTPQPTVTVTAAPKAAAASKPAPTVTVTATVTAKAAAAAPADDSASGISADVDGDWTLVSLKTGPDYSGDWTGTARVKYTGTDESAEGSFTITLFKGSGQETEATFMGVASSVEVGRIVTVDLISTDKYHKGTFRHEFQKDF